MSLLFSPWQLGRLSLVNRIVIAPMAQYTAIHGCASDWHTVHLGHLALSGAGLLILEATAVTEEGRITAGDLALYADDQEAALSRLLTTLRSMSPIALAMQLGHSGRKGSSHVPWEGGTQIARHAPSGWPTVAPSPVPHSPDDVPPVALDAAGLARVREGFAQAARRAARAGIDGLELHAAHGYLLHQFLSPLSNHRQDDYGGSLAKRMRFPLEVFDAVREAFPSDRPVWVRLSATDWVDGGWALDHAVAFARALAKRGCAAVHVSTGGLSTQQKIVAAPGYQLPFAATLKAETGLPTIGVGLITEPDQAEALLARGDADAVALGRAMLYNPRWPWHAAAALGAQVDVPPQYWRCQPPQHRHLFGSAGITQR